MFGTIPGLQVGRLGGHATLWNSATQAIVDLHPIGLPFNSTAFAIAGDQQVGTYSGTSVRATLWRGTAASAIDLTPANASSSKGYATDGVRQGGVASINQVWHAGIWSGSAQSFVDLNPGPNFESWLFGMAPGQQVGYTHAAASPTRAAVWSGTAATLLDLHPAIAIGDSVLYATTGTVQVGDCAVPGGTFPHAGIWFGTAASFMDLHPFLPPGYSGSRATSVVQMPDGSITVGGWAVSSASPGYQRAFMWSNIPSPGGLGIFFAAACLTARRRRALP